MAGVQRRARAWSASIPVPLAARFFDVLTHGRSATPAVIPSAPHRRADRLSRESWPGRMDEASDEALRGGIAKGDETAFRLLARRYAARAIALARRITGNDADAEEIVQEALLRVWTNAPRWRPLAAFRTWFYRVVLNLCLSRRRQARFVALEAAGDPADPAADLAASNERDETERRLPSPL